MQCAARTLAKSSRFQLEGHKVSRATSTQYASLDRLTWTTLMKTLCESILTQTASDETFCMCAVISALSAYLDGVNEDPVREHVVVQLRVPRQAHLLRARPPWSARLRGHPHRAAVRGVVDLRRDMSSVTFVNGGHHRQEAHQQMQSNHFKLAAQMRL